MNWLDSVREAYRVAFAERRNELDATYVKRFDERGLHPFSVIVGEVWTIQQLSGIETDFDPIILRKAAHADADAAFRADVMAGAA